MKTGVVLGSGGVRGLAHVGVLQALEEAGIDPDVIVGSSAGAVIGGLYAAGKTPQDIRELIRDFKVYKFIDFTNIGGGILKGEKAKVFLNDQLDGATFDDLTMPFTVNALDLNEKRVVHMDDGDVASAIRASMAIPGVFKPVQRDDRFLLDAGYVNPLPVQALSDCDRVIIVDVNPEQSEIDEDTRFHDIIQSFFHYVQNTFRDDQVQAYVDEHANTDVTVITPDTYDWSMLSFSELESVVERGYDAATNTLTET